MLNSTKTWQEKFDELKGVRKSLQELWALNKDDHNRVNSDLSFIELRLGEIINNLTDLRKRDMEALIGMLPKEGDEKYELSPTDRQIGYDIALEIIKDYYEN